MATTFLGASVYSIKWGPDNHTCHHIRVAVVVLRLGRFSLRPEMLLNRNYECRNSAPACALNHHSREPPKIVESRITGIAPHLLLLAMQKIGQHVDIGNAGRAGADL
jgi:hypothetical protein